MTLLESLLTQLFDDTTAIVPAEESQPLQAVREYCSGRPLSEADSVALIESLARSPRVDPGDEDSVRRLMLRQAVISNPVGPVANALLTVSDRIPTSIHRDVINALWRIDSQVDDQILLGSLVTLLDTWVRQDRTMDWSGILDSLVDRPRHVNVTIPTIRDLGELPQILHETELVRTSYLHAGLLSDEHRFASAYTQDRLRPLAAHYPERLTQAIVAQAALRLEAGSTFDSLPDVLAQPIIATEVEHQVMNGGLHQLFWNRPELADYCVPTFEALGLVELAAVLASAVETFRANAARIRPSSTAAMVEDFAASAALRLFTSDDAEFIALHERRTIDEALAEYLPPRVAALAAALADEPFDAAEFAAIPVSRTALRPPAESPTDAHVLAIHGSPDMPILWHSVTKPVDAEFSAPMLEVQQYSAPIWGYSIENEARDLGAGASTIVAGFGWGGVVAVAAALARPVGGLFLVEPLLVSSLSGAIGARIEYLLSEFVGATKADRRDAIEDYVEMWYGPGSWRAMSDAKKSFFREKAPWCAADVETVLGYFPPLERITKLAIPVTVVVGAESPEPMQAIGNAIGHAIPHARSVSIDGATHSILETHPAALVPHLQSLVDEVRERATGR